MNRPRPPLAYVMVPRILFFAIGFLALTWIATGNPFSAIGIGAFLMWLLSYISIMVDLQTVVETERNAILYAVEATLQPLLTQKNGMSAEDVAQVLQGISHNDSDQDESVEQGKVY